MFSGIQFLSFGSHLFNGYNLVHDRRTDHSCPEQLLSLINDDVGNVAGNPDRLVIPKIVHSASSGDRMVRALA